MSSDATDRQATTLAAKIDRLFRALTGPRGRQYSHRDVANAINGRGEPTISPTYIWQLRTGLKDNPTKKHLEALAEFFGVPPAYFFDDEASARVDEQLELLLALQDDSVRHLALRARGLSTESLHAIAEMIERVRALEGLPSAEEDQDGRGLTPGKVRIGRRSAPTTRTGAQPT